MLKLLQEFQNRADVSLRRAVSRPPGLFLVEMRSYLRGAPRNGKRLIRVSMDEPCDIPHPVPITRQPIDISHGLRRLG